MTLTLTEAIPDGLAGARLIHVLKPGVQTTVQDGVGRTGLWDVGVPPSGAFDSLSFALASTAVGNPTTAAGLECVLTGPVLRFDADALVCVAGAATAASLDETVLGPGIPTHVRAGAVLDVGKLAGPGMRGYVTVAGGIDTVPVLGSRSTFVLGKFGGFAGRPLLRGDRLPLGDSGPGLAAPVSVAGRLPRLGGPWDIRVIPGPHGAPGHLLPAGMAELFQATWVVDHRSDRTGVRLTGPTPQWARPDGGEAGLHPSNVHDSAYPVGGIMLSGDTPVIVGPDGPSLGGFVVPCVVIGADRWKLGQLRPGDAVHLVPVTLEQADRARINFAGWGYLPTKLGEDEGARSVTGGTEVDNFVSAGEVDPPPTSLGGTPSGQPGGRPEALVALPAAGHRPSITVRLAGDRHVLVEAGPLEFDLSVRMWIHLLAGALRQARPAGVTEIVEGVRSLLVGLDELTTTPVTIADQLSALTGALADPAAVVLDVREVTLPIAFDDPAVHDAMQRYERVNPTAPWSPDNVEFIRRMNDLSRRDDVFEIVEAATYLVVGLGDVYLGAPVAVPIDPRHRLVTTKYNPARTWTPQNAVGIGGIYLCVYGMEGPGGYQLLGRTVPVWRLSAGDEKPWLLRQFDRLRFTPVSPDELADTRADILAGRADLVTRPATFSLAEVADLQSKHQDEIRTLRATRQRAFAAERTRWEAAP